MPENERMTIKSLRGSDLLVEAEGKARQLQEMFAVSGDDRLLAIASSLRADIMQSRGDLDEALRIRREEMLPVFERLGDERESAITMGKIADIAEARGEFDEALDIRRKQLPVFERLGDIRERAVTMGKIADIAEARGNLDEALRIRREETLPIYERLGDVRSRAVTMGLIADIMQARGDLDEAMHIRREQLPVFERLGDSREHAVAMGKIADIAQARGDLDEALSICAANLAVFERLGDTRERAVTMGKIADIAEARGDLDRALRIRREQLPVYERLDDIRERAVTMGKIADIAQARGDLDEALRIRREETLPVFERLGDVRSRAVTMGKIADIAEARGDPDEALRIRRHDILPIFERLGDVREGAVTMGKIADIAETRGDPDEALRIRRHEILPVFERIGDARSKATTLLKIATALLQSDGLQEERVQDIFDALAEAYAIFLRLQAPDGIGYAGIQLAQVLALGGARDEALGVLDQAEMAFRKLGRSDGIEFVQQLRSQIAEMQAPDPKDLPMTFVLDLPLDRDPRLAALRPSRPSTTFDARRDGGTQAATAVPTEIDDRLRAAVNGSSLISFVGGLSVAQKSDVLYSTQLAQRAASARFDRITATKDWYGVYVEVLERLGWLGEAFAFTERGSDAGDFSLDKSALEVIQAVATGNQLAVLVKTLDVLKKLGGDDRAIKIFELRALAEASGNFQLGAAQAAENGVVALALGAFHFTADDTRTQVLFAKWGGAHIRFWTAVRKMSLIPESYARHRQAVIDKVEADAGDYIAALRI